MKDQKKLKKYFIISCCITIACVLEIIYILSQGHAEKNMAVLLVLFFIGIISIYSTLTFGVVGLQKKSVPVNTYVKREKKELTDEQKAKLDKFLEMVKKERSIPYYKISLSKEDNISIFDSKYGGTPYWDMEMKYPEGLYLLAQINFEKEKFDNDLLPKDGMLQIFIDPNDEGWGLKFDGDYSKQEGWKVVYHKKVDYSVSEDNIKKMGIPSNLDIDTYLMPVNGEYKMVFTPDIDYSIYNDNAQDELFDILKESGIIEDIKESFWDNFTSEEYDYLYDKLSSAGNKLLGYPYFVQYEPRNTKEEKEHYDTLLFQSDYCKEIMWGDAGVATFFINKEKLKKGDFSDILYYWDCS